MGRKHVGKLTNIHKGGQADPVLKLLAAQPFILGASWITQAVSWLAPEQRHTAASAPEQAPEQADRRTERRSASHPFKQKNGPNPPLGFWFQLDDPNRALVAGCGGHSRRCEGPRRRACSCAAAGAAAAEQPGGWGWSTRFEVRGAVTVDVKGRAVTGG